MALIDPTTLDERTRKWQLRFLKEAREVSEYSKDPSTKVGAVIATPEHEPVSRGYNGFPRRVRDLPERYSDRETKYSLIIHGEINALRFARGNTDGNVLYTWPFMPCCRCAGIIIQFGIARVVAPVTPPAIAARWKKETELAQMMFAEAGVELILYPWMEIEAAIGVSQGVNPVHLRLYRHSRTGLLKHLESRGETELPDPNDESACYRICQEIKIHG